MTNKQFIVGPVALYESTKMYITKTIHISARQNMGIWLKKL